LNNQFIEWNSFAWSADTFPSVFNRIIEICTSWVVEWAQESCVIQISDF